MHRLLQAEVGITDIICTVRARARYLMSLLQLSQLEHLCVSAFTFLYI